MLDKVLSLFKNIKPEKWKARLNGKNVERKRINFNIVQILTKRALAFSIIFNDGARERALDATTRFKSDGTDKITLDGVELQNADIDFDLLYRGFKLIAQVEFRGTDAAGVEQEFTIYSSLGFMGFGSLFG
jgi:hypothetical protein